MPCSLAHARDYGIDYVNYHVDCPTRTMTIAQCGCDLTKYVPPNCKVIDVAEVELRIIGAAPSRRQKSYALLIGLGTLWRACAWRG